MISRILIQNIRGFESVDLDVAIRPNLPNIVVAPNGFGKSSISTAFKCAERSRLEVPTSEKFMNDDRSVATLKIMVDGNWLEANATKNEISEWANIFVIKSSIEPKAKLPKVNGFTVAKPYMQIPDLDLGPAPKNERLSYQHAVAKTKMSPNQKVVPNLAVLCSQADVREALLDVLGDIDKMKQVTSSRLFDEIAGFIQTETGTREDIASRVEGAFKYKVSQDGCINNVMNVLLRRVNGVVWTTAFLLCDQLRDLCVSDRSNLKKWLLRGEFEARAERARTFITDINSGWVSAKVKEEKSRLVVHFPDASSLSNGQRDLLFFACNLMKANNQASSKRSVVIVDEVFDYLDDANLIVAQYFLSKLVEAFRKGGGQLYLLIMTHLDPAFFKGYAFSRQKVVYLCTATQRVSETMKTVILRRDDPRWSAQIPKYFLHYDPEECDLSTVFNSDFGLPKRHGKSSGFYSFLHDEWKKLDSGAKDYDPFAVCAFLRIDIERRMFNKLSCAEHREEFLKTNGTASKIEFARSVGIEVPEVCVLLGVLYNEAMHNKGSLDQTSTIAVKLKNMSLRAMMRSAVNW